MQHALRHHQADRLSEAAALYRRVLAADPYEPVALQNLGLIALHHRRYRYAAELIGKAAIRSPNDPGIHYNLGLAQQQVGRLEAAAASYAKALALRPDFAEARYNRANALKELGWLHAAVGEYRRVLTLRPDLTQACANLATSLAELGRADEAVAQYRAALAQQPNSAELHNNLGTALADLGRLDEAASFYRRALTCNPDSADAWFNLHGVLYDEQGERAAGCLEAALRIAPNHALSRFLLAVLRKAQGREAEAEAHFAALPAGCELAGYGRDSWDYVKAASGGRPRLFGETVEGLALGLGAAKLDGLVLEFGVRYGTTLRQIAERAGQEVHGFDTFTGLPEDWHDLAAGTYSAEGQRPPVPGNARLHAGLFTETLPPFLAAHVDPVRFVNIDCDLYSSTQTVLTHLARWIVRGTVIVFDEYLFTPHWREDEFKAFHEAVTAHGWRYDYLAFSLLSKQAVVIIR